MSTNAATKKLKALVKIAKKTVTASPERNDERSEDGKLALSLNIPNQRQRSSSTDTRRTSKQGSGQNLNFDSDRRTRRSSKEGSSQNLSLDRKPSRRRSRQGPDELSQTWDQLLTAGARHLFPEKTAARKTSSKWLGKKEKKRKKFSEDLGNPEDLVSRSPSRLGYSEDWENTGQETHCANCQINIKGRTANTSPKSLPETKDRILQVDLAPPVIVEEKPKREFVTSHKFLNEDTPRSAQPTIRQTSEQPTVPTTGPGSSPKHPYEKTVFFVKSPGEHKLLKSDSKFNHTVTNSLHRPITSHTGGGDSQTPRLYSSRLDSGYASRAETLRHSASPYKPPSPYSYKSTSEIKPVVDILCLRSPGRSENVNVPVPGQSELERSKNSPGRSVDVESRLDQDQPDNMSYYITDNYSPLSSARRQEKEDLQLLNERFGNYVQKVRTLSEQSNRMDSNAFIKQTRILEEEMANLKTMYDRELDAIRQDLNATHKESHNYQIQCEKNKQAAIDFESRLAVEMDKSRRLLDNISQQSSIRKLAVETDKSRRLMDDINLLQQKSSNLETELMGLRQAGDGRADFQGLQREMDKIIRENEDHKHRQEQNALLRAEAEDRCHTLTKKLEFNDQVHAQQIAEIRERLEQSQATILSLESRVREASKVETTMPEVLKQVRDQAEMELKRFSLESEENYNRNISSLKCQMDNDANTIERLSNDKALLQGQIGELAAKIRTLEGQIITADHQRRTAEEMIEQERSRSAAQIQEMEKKLREMHEIVFSKMREAGTARDLHLPLKAEIEAMKVLLQEEEKRLQSPLVTTTSQYQQYSSGTSYIPPVPVSLPAVSTLAPATSTTSQYQYTPAPPPQPPTTQYTPAPPTSQFSATQHYQPLESPFITQSAAHNQYATEHSAAHSQYATDQAADSQEPLFTHVALPSEPDEDDDVSGEASAKKSSESNASLDDFVGTTRYTYETTPSVNRLHIDNPPANSPRVVGPIARAKSAPVQRGQNISLVPTNLGRGKDYFDEMFRDLTRETLYTQTRPKSSPTERPPSSGPRDKPPSGAGDRARPGSSRERPASAARERPPSRERPSSQADILREVLQEDPPTTTTEEQQVTTGTDYTLGAGGDQGRSSADRPQSSVYHDYTTTTASAVGDIKILEVNQEGRFVRLVNEGKQELEFGGYMIQQNVGGHPVAVFRFPPRTKFAENSTITVWSGSTEDIEHQPPKNFVWKEQHKWGTGPECTSILCKPNGQAIAWMTAAHRFTKNPYDEAQDCSTPQDEIIPDTGIPTNTQEEVLTEMNVNLNEQKPDPVYLRREKQVPPSLIAQKHPHGSSMGKDTHPQTGQARPLTYGNDNSSVNRQSRVQSTRPDPIPGQPYAGGSGNRIGSAPLKKFPKGAGPSSTTIRGSGAIANRSIAMVSPSLESSLRDDSNEWLHHMSPGVTSPPPTAFQTPHARFESGLEQIQSQHHTDFLPPMPRPPLFSTW